MIKILSGNNEKIFPLISVVFIGVHAYMDATLVAIHMGMKTRS